MKIKDLYPIFADGKLPEYPVKIYANGAPASLTWKWEFVKLIHEDSDEPPEGVNHLRIEINAIKKPNLRPLFDEARRNCMEIINSIQTDTDCTSGEIITYLQKVIYILENKVNTAQLNFENEGGPE